MTAASVLVIPVAITLGALAPQTIGMFLAPARPRGDFYQWRWGVVVGGAAAAVLSLSSPTPAKFQGLAGFMLLALYIAGKRGCERYGCCGAVKFRVVNATASLPATEVRVTAAFLILVAVCLIADEPRMGAEIALASHLALRTMAHWVRGERLDAAGLARMPDLFALLLLILGLILG